MARTTLHSPIWLFLEFRPCSLMMIAWFGSSQPHLYSLGMKLFTEWPNISILVISPWACYFGESTETASNWICLLDYQSPSHHVYSNLGKHFVLLISHLSAVHVIPLLHFSRKLAKKFIQILDVWTFVHDDKHLINYSAVDRSVNVIWFVVTCDLLVKQVTIIWERTRNDVERVA